MTPRLTLITMTGLLALSLVMAFVPAALPRSAAAATSDVNAATYVCPMHPEVTSPAPGDCPKCHMKLEPKP